MDQRKLMSEEKVRVGPALLEVGRILRRHVAGLIALGLGVLVPLELIGAALTRGNPDVPRSGAPVGTDVLSALIKLEPVMGDVLVLLIGVPLLAGTAVLLTAAAQTDRTLDVAGAVRGAARRIATLFLVTLTLALGVGIVAGVAGLLDLVIPGILPTGSIADVVASVVILAGLAALLPLAVAAYPAAMLERSSGLDTVRSALRLAGDGFVMLLGRAIAIVAVASILGTIARFVVMLVVGLVGSGPFANAIGEAVADTVFIPVFAAAATLVYVDIRGRQGDMDQEVLARRIGTA